MKYYKVMISIIFLYIVAFIILGINISYSQEQANPKNITLESLLEASKIIGENRTNFTEFSDIIIGVKFEYPSNWVLHYSDFNRIRLVLTHELDYEGIRQVAIVWSMLDKDYETIEEFAREYLSSVQSRPSGWYHHIVDFNKTQIAGNEAIELVTIEHKDDRISNKYNYFVIMLDGEHKNAYSISYDENIREHHDENIANIRHLINTFKLIGFE